MLHELTENKDAIKVFVNVAEEAKRGHKEADALATAV
jgi:hypothetical protein